MAYLEKNFQTDLGRWILNRYNESCAYELKAVKGASCPFSALAPHQKGNLLAVKHGGMNYKIPDLGNQNPFDGVFLKGLPAYVGIMFNTEKQKRVFYWIDIDTFTSAEATALRKSLTEDRAGQIGRRFVLGE